MQELLPIAKKHTGIEALIKNTCDGIEIRKLEQVELNKIDLPTFVQHESLMNGSACVFTSGSTAEAKPVVYSWESLFYQALETIHRTPLFYQHFLSYSSPSPTTTSQFISLLSSHPSILKTITSQKNESFNSNSNKVENGNINEEDRNETKIQIIAASPISHAYAINTVFVSLFSSIPLGLPDMNRLVNYLQETKEIPAIFFSSPATYQKLVNEKEKFNIQSAYSAGCPLPKDVWKEWKEKLNVNIMQNFGTSETGNIAVFDEPLDDYYDGYVGTCWGNLKLKPISSFEKYAPEAQDYEKGAIYVKVKWMSKGYVINGKLKEHQEFHPTGDLGKISKVSHPKGLFVGPRLREKITIKKNDDSILSVYPWEIECQLSQCPLIQEVVAIQKTLDHFGIYLLPKEQERDIKESILIEKFNDWCEKTNLVDIWKPKSIKIMKEFPRSPAGKIIYQKLSFE